MKNIFLSFLIFIIPLMTFAQNDTSSVHCMNKDVLAIDDSGSAKTIVFDLQISGYMAMIDQMVCRIKNSSDEKTIQSCEEIIKYAIAQLKQISGSTLDAKYALMIQNILSYYLKGMQFLIDNFEGYWSETVKIIAHDLSGWIQNQKIYLDFCDQMSLFGILLFLSDAKEQNVDDIASNIMSNLTLPEIDDFAALMVYNLSYQSFCMKKDIMTDIVNALYSASSRYDKSSPFYRFLETLKTFSENFDPLKEWPYGQYDSTAIMRCAQIDWHRIVNLL